MIHDSGRDKLLYTPASPTPSMSKRFLAKISRWSGARSQQTSSDSDSDTSSNASLTPKQAEKCNICFGQIKKPIRLPCQPDQGHIFCEACIEKWFLTSRTCPSCRKIIPKNQEPVKNKIKIHQNDHVPQMVQCPSTGCSLMVEPGSLDAHTTSCVYAKSHLWSNWNPCQRIDPPRSKPKWLNAPSSVADLILLPDNTTAVICYRGQILNLANIPCEEARINWRSRTQLPNFIAQGRTQICHAAFDHTTLRMYFTLCPLQEGIVWADWAEIEAAAKTTNGAVELKPLVARQMRPSNDRLRQYWGLTAVPQLQVVICCHRYPNSMGIWSATREDGDRGSSYLLAEIGFNNDLIDLFLPFRCAAYVSFAAQNSWHITLAVDDIKQSRLHLLGIHARCPEDEADVVFDCKFEQIVAVQGSQYGFVRSPDGLHFDPDGKLLVSDAGNHRIQMFAASGGIQSQWDGDFLASSSSTSKMRMHRRRSNSDYGRWRSVWTSSYSAPMGRYADDAPAWCSMKATAVVAPLDEATKRPFILAGLWNDEDVVCFRQL